MRGLRVCVPMMTLCLLLVGCGAGEDGPGGAEALRAPYQTMTACHMTAEVVWGDASQEVRFTLRCDYTPETSTVEVLAPETVAGIKAVLSGEDMTLAWEGESLPAGTLSSEEISPAACLPRLMSALQSGWLLEENQEDWGETPCLRMALDQTGGAGGKIVSTLWLRESDGVPLRGEISVAGEKILQAEFTDFGFRDTMTDDTGAEHANQ